MNRQTILTVLGLAALALTAGAWPTPENDAAGKNLLEVSYSELPKHIPAVFRDGNREMAKVSLSEQVKRSGARSLQVERVMREGNTRFSLASVPVNGGGRYYFSCYVKATAGNPAVSIELQNAARQNVPGDLIDYTTTMRDVSFMYGGHMVAWQRQLSDQPDQFNRLEAIFTVPPGTAFVNFVIGYSWTTGTAWYDDFEFYPLDEDRAASQ